MNAPPQTHGAFELKFVLTNDQVGPVIEWAMRHVPADPYGDPTGVYEVNSLYFDTDHFGVFYRHEGLGERKYRVRRYGKEGILYLEEKEKSKGWVRKRRTPIAESELCRVEGHDATWSGAWFASVVRENGLAPRSQVAYRRIARVGEAEGSPIRLTIDRGLSCAAAEALALPRICPDEALPIDRNVLELKFGRNGLPALYKRLIAEFGLESDASSKYRLSVVTAGLTGELAAA